MEGQRPADLNCMRSEVIYPVGGRENYFSLTFSQITNYSSNFYSDSLLHALLLEAALSYFITMSSSNFFSIHISITMITNVYISE
jgi:hypothetical protein